MNQPETIYRFLTLEEAQGIFQMSESHLRELIARGAIPAWRPSTQTVRIPYWVAILQVSREFGIDLPDLPEPLSPRAI